MSAINAMSAEFQEVTLLGIPALFTPLRVDRKTVPKGMYAYDMQTSEEDWNYPSLLAKQIMVEHYGTALTASPISLPAGGYLDLSPSDFHMDYDSMTLTVREFERKYLSPTYQPPPHRHRPKNPALAR